MYESEMQRLSLLIVFRDKVYDAEVLARDQQPVALPDCGLFHLGD